MLRRPPRSSRPDTLLPDTTLCRSQGIAYMEAVTMPLEWADFPEQARDLFQAFRSQAGEELVLQDNVFVEQVLPGLILRPLSEAEMAAYREPFLAAGEA